MRRSLGGLLALVLSGLILVVACGSSDPIEASDTGGTQSVPEPPWAEEAAIWTDAIVEVVQERGGSAWEFFWAPNLRLDYRTMGPGLPVFERSNALFLMKETEPPGTDALSSEDPAFISTDGAILLTFQDWGRAGKPGATSMATITALPGHLANILAPIGVNGAERMVSAFASESWRERRPSTAEPDEADEFAARFIATWSGEAPVEGLYATDAVLTDFVADVEARGPAEIGGLIGAGSTTRWAIATVGDGIPSVYPLVPVPPTLDGLVLVVDGDDGTVCPGRLAALLTVTDGLIVAEERYWQIEQARRCLPEDGLPDGWWVGRELTFERPPVPTENVLAVTGMLAVGDTEIEMRNSTERLDAFVEWGLLRFEQAGLARPNVGSVTFTAYSEYCSDLRGRVLQPESRWDVYLCFDETTACIDDDCSISTIGARRVLLHELAHVWLGDHLSESERERFTELVGLEVWKDHSVDWDRRASEHAADTISWGLLDEPLTMIYIGSPASDQLREHFQALTGVDSLQNP